MQTIGPYWVGDKPRDSVEITIVRDGQPVDLDGYTGATIELRGATGTVLPTAGVVVDLDAAADVVTVTWPTTTSLFTEPGMYLLQVLLTGADTVDRADPIVIPVQEVQAASDAGWATVHDVLTLTGVEVSSGVLAQAHGVIELYAGSSWEATLDDDGVSGLSVRDRRLLRQAVAYQAAFIAPQEGVFSRAGATSVNQDGMAATVAGPDAWVLAPLAARALKQISWTAGGDRTVHLRRGRRRRWDDDDTGVVAVWQPMDAHGRPLR